MRTTAPVRRSPASAAPKTAAAGRRDRSASKAAAQEAAPPPAPAPAPQQPAPSPIAVTAVRMMRLEEGLHALHIGPIAGAAGEAGGMAVPAAQISAPFADAGNGVEIIASFPGKGPWVGQQGGTAILRSPPRGGFVVVTVYSGAGHEAAAPAVDLQRLDGQRGSAAEAAVPAAMPAAGAPAAADASGREIPSEILLHIERAGDRLFPGRGWVGALGRRMRIEAFSIRPLERLAPTDIEMKGLLPNGGETAWVPGGVLCGTRGRGLPLIGFAVRIAAQRAGEFEVVYQGSFFSGGISEPQRNGNPCRSPTLDDPLEAVNVRLIERGAEPDAAADPG